VAMQTQQMQIENLTGTVERVIFHNPENGYCVLKLRIEGQADSISAVGHIPAIRQGDEYSLTGQWKRHPKFGNQFVFQSYEVIVPQNKSGIIRYLANTIPGIGPVKAAMIVDRLGENCLQLIQEDPGCLNQLEFIKPWQVAEITEQLSQNSTIAELASIICRDGIGMGIVSKIHAQYGSEAVKVVKENPYILSEELFGIGFIKADAIAQSVGIEPNSPYRIEAAIQYLIREAGAEGHVYLRPRDIVEGLIGRKGIIAGSGVEVGDIAKATEALVARQSLVREGDCIYFHYLCHAEKQLAAGIRGLINRERVRWPEVTGQLDSLEVQSGIEYAPQQREAVKVALESSLSIITGGPGTGKTTVINAICDLYSQKYPRHCIYLAAPTGRAAQRMSEATGREAKTIHRLLRYQPIDGCFEYGYGNPLPGPGLVIIDEASMIDIELARDLFSAFDNHQVVLVGDIDQLPSVGPGSVLRDAIGSGMVPTVRLQYNFRQAGGSKIAEFANMVCRGELPPLVSQGDYSIVLAEDAEEATGKVMALVSDALMNGYGIMDFQVLAPMRRGSAGVKNLNEKVRDMVNPASPEKPEFGGFRLGDKVMVIKNDYQLGVFNGDIGRVVGVQNGLLVDIDGFKVEFAPEQMELLTLAYASTIHKSQGSEFPLVIMVLVNQHYVMLQRNLLYTGMTRARNNLVLVCQEQAVKRAAKNDLIAERFSNLKVRLSGEL
jgi:exodeoxyribonuclease V alpha subunit